MTPLLPTRALGTVCRRWHHRWAAACGAGLLFILASGLALGFGAVVERLATMDVATADHRSDAAQASMTVSLADVFDGWYSDPTRASSWTAGTTRRHVVDRWYDEPASP